MQNRMELRAIDTSENVLIGRLIALSSETNQFQFDASLSQSTFVRSRDALAWWSKGSQAESRHTGALGILGKRTSNFLVVMCFGVVHPLRICLVFR